MSSKGAAGLLLRQRPCHRVGNPAREARVQMPGSRPVALPRSRSARSRDPCGALPDGRENVPRSEADTSGTYQARVQLAPKPNSSVWTLTASLLPAGHLLSAPKLLTWNQVSINSHIQATRRLTDRSRDCLLNGRSCMREQLPLN